MSADPSEKVRIDCPQCGKQLMVPTSALGKTGKCPGCQHMFPLQASGVPSRSAAPPVVRKPPVATAPAPPLANANADPFGNLSGFDQGAQPMGQQPFGAPQSPHGAPQQFGQQPTSGFAPAPGLQQPNPSQWASNPYASTQAPSRSKQRAKKSSDDATPMGQIGFGILMMIGAVVWFVGGLMADIIFFYPPILFVLGLVSMITGFVGLGKR